MSLQDLTLDRPLGMFQTMTKRAEPNNIKWFRVISVMTVWIAFCKTLGALIWSNNFSSPNGGPKNSSSNSFFGEPRFNYMMIGFITISVVIIQSIFSNLVSIFGNPLLYPAFNSFSIVSVYIGLVYKYLLPIFLIGFIPVFVVGASALIYFFSVFYVITTPPLFKLILSFNVILSIISHLATSFISIDTII